MSDNFRKFMNSISDDLLEEAKAPRKTRRIIPLVSVAAAACLLAAVALPAFLRQEGSVSYDTLSAMGYDMTLPCTAEDISYEVVTLANRDGAEARFSIDGTDYIYQAFKTAEPQSLVESDGEEVRLLSWNAAELDMQLASSEGSCSVSWYSPDEQTQWYLSSDTDSQQLLTTASQLLSATGLDVAVAPNNAQDITYDAFSLGELTVAETSFVFNGVACRYRMAATLELQEDFADISGLDIPFESAAEGEVRWCAAKLSFNEGGQGKIVWFDLVPGILYSLSVDSGASESSLLQLANELFEPAQGDN